MNTHFNQTKLNDISPGIIDQLINFPKMKYINGDLNMVNSSDIIVFKLALLYFANTRIVSLDPFDFIKFDDYVSAVKIIVEWSKKQKWINKIVFIPLNNKILISTYRYWHIGSLSSLFKNTFDTFGISKIDQRMYLGYLKPTLFDSCNNPYRYQIYIGSPSMIIHTFYSQKNLSKIEIFISELKEIFGRIKDVSIGINEGSQIDHEGKKRWCNTVEYGDKWINGDSSLNIDDDVVTKFRTFDYSSTGTIIYPHIIQIKYLK